MIISEKKLRHIISSMVSKSINEARRHIYLQGTSASEIGGVLDNEPDYGDEMPGQGGYAHKYTGGAPKSTSVPGDAMARAVKHAEATGLDPAWIYATEMVESGTNPASQAFNGDDFIDNLKKNGKEALIPKAIAAGFTRKNQAFTSGQGPPAYAKAKAIDHYSACEAAAWGRYQVMGWTSLKSFGNDPNALEAAFKSDPAGFSDTVFMRWIKDHGMKFKNAVNITGPKDGYLTSTTMYYGRGERTRKYAAKISKYVAQYRKGQEGGTPPRVASQGPVSTGDCKSKYPLSSFVGRLGCRTKGGENFHELRHKGTGGSNYRAGIKGGVVLTSKKFFEELKTKYKIKTVITLNSDAPINSAHVTGAGLKHIEIHLSESAIKNMNKTNWEIIRDALDDGNALIHCNHGADRTGATVGRWYVERHKWDAEKAQADANKYKARPTNMPVVNNFIKNGPTVG